MQKTIKQLIKYETRNLNQTEIIAADKKENQLLFLLKDKKNNWYLITIIIQFENIFFLNNDLTAPIIPIGSKITYLNDVGAKYFLTTLKYKKI